MMRTFTFTADEEAEVFCSEIVEEMVHLFQIAADEARGRIERHFKGQSIGGPKEMLYHEEPPYWAKIIYYERDTMWWSEEWLAEHVLRPRPFP